MCGSDHNLLLYFRSLSGHKPFANHKRILRLLWRRIIVESADWLVPHHPAKVSCPTGSRQAGVNTVVILTGGGEATVIVHNALAAEAACVTVTHSSHWTLAGERVTLQDAEGALAAGVGVAGVRSLHALLLVRANVTGATVRVNGAFRSTTCDSVRFRDEAGQTFADWITVPVGRARGSGSAGRRVARIWLLHALLVLANIAVVTVGVHHALRAATSDGIRLRDEASQAATDGITVPVGGARGARSARGRVAGVTDFASNFGCGVRDQTFRTLAGRLSLVGDAH